MILMNWTRIDDGGLPTFRVSVNRSWLARSTIEQLIKHMQRIYCHEQSTMALYQALAANSANPTRRDIFMRLAYAEAHQLGRRAELLQRLNATVPAPCLSRLDRSWQRLLVWTGPRLALAWIRYVKRGDVRRQLHLAQLLKYLME